MRNSVLIFCATALLSLFSVGNGSALELSNQFVQTNQSYQITAIISLPRYTGEFAYRTQDGGRDKTELDCASKGGVEKGTNQTCSGLFSVGGATCYKECHCDTSIYKYTEANKSTYGCESVSGASCVQNGTTYFKDCKVSTCNSQNIKWVSKDVVGGFQDMNYICTMQPAKDVKGDCYECACNSSWSLGSSCPANYQTCEVCSAQSPYIESRYNLTRCKDGYKIVTSDGKKTCQKCPKGTYSEDGINCYNCPLGTFGTGEGYVAQIQCSPCPMGYYGKTAGKTSQADGCQACPVGYKGKNEGQQSQSAGCEACSGSTQYQDQIGQTSCKDCSTLGWAPNSTHTLCVCSSNEATCKKEPIWRAQKITSASALDANATAFSTTCSPRCSNDTVYGYKITACASGYSVAGNGASCAKDVVPDKTCSEWLTEQGYKLATTKEELEAAMKTGSQDVVVMNDISSVSLEDYTPINKSIYTPGYFHSQYSACANITPTIQTNYNVDLSPASGQTINIYPHLDGQEIYASAMPANSTVNFYGNLSLYYGINGQAGNIGLYGPVVYFEDYAIYAPSATLTVGGNTHIYNSDFTGMNLTNLILKKGAIVRERVDGDTSYKYEITATSDINYNIKNRLPFTCTANGSTTNYGKAKCKGAMTSRCMTDNDTYVPDDSGETEVSLALCQDCGAVKMSYPDYCNNFQSCTWVTSLNSTGHCVGTTGSYIRCTTSHVDGFKDVGTDWVNGEDQCGNSRTFEFTPVQKCYNACTDDRGFDFEVTNAWKSMKGISSFDSEQGYIAYCDAVLRGGEGDWGTGNYYFYHNGRQYTTSENAMSTCKCLRACNDKDLLYPTNYY